MTEPFAWFRYQQGSRVYYDSKKWDDCQPLYTQSASEYERGFIDGMQKQLQSDVTRVMEGGTRNQVIEEVAQHIEKLTGFGQDTISSFAIYIRGMKK